MIVKSRCRAGLVVDTNVMAHADHKGTANHDSALVLLTWLRDHESIHLVLDDQGKAAPDLSTSVLATEYRATLSPQGFALNLFAALLGSKRVAFADRPDYTTRRCIAKLVPGNTADRAVLGAATGCQDKLLVSNDFGDFPHDVRDACRDELGVDVMDSDQAVA